jgi:ABC-type taurine transport system ATPase subunit
MSHLSKTKINILFLDEIMGVLDNFGKDKLIEILLSETELNTFLVSHEFTHPLLDKITIIKEDDISRIDNG